MVTCVHTMVIFSRHETFHRHLLIHMTKNITVAICTPGLLVNRTFGYNIQAHQLIRELQTPGRIFPSDTNVRILTLAGIIPDPIAPHADSTGPVPLYTWDDLQCLKAAMEDDPLLQTLSFSFYPGNQVYAEEKRQLSIRALNERFLRPYHVNLFILVSDVFVFEADEKVACPSVAWFPNHSEPLSPLDLSSLSAFHAVGALTARMTDVLQMALPHHTVHYVPHFVSLPSTYDTRDPSTMLSRVQRIVPSSIVFGYVGANYDRGVRKGQDALLRIFRKYLDAGGKGSLWMHTPKGQDGVDLQALCRDLGLDAPRFQERLFLMEQVLEDPARVHLVYENVDLFLLPTRTEGFALTLVEAQMHGIPCISTGHCASRDNNWNGMVVEPKDITWMPMVQSVYAEPDEDAFVKAMLDMEANYPIWRARARAIAPLVQSVVHPDNVCKQWSRILSIMGCIE